MGRAEKRRRWVRARSDGTQTGAQSGGSRPEGRACRPQAAAMLPPEPEREDQHRGPLGPSTRDFGTGHGGFEQRRDSRAPVPVGVYDQAAPARRLQAAGGAQQDRGGQNDAGARSRRLRERRSRARKEWTLYFLSPIHQSAWKRRSRKFGVAPTICAEDAYVVQ